MSQEFSLNEGYRVLLGTMVRRVLDTQDSGGRLFKELFKNTSKKNLAKYEQFVVLDPVETRAVSVDFQKHPPLKQLSDALRKILFQGALWNGTTLVDEVCGVHDALMLVNVKKPNAWSDLARWGREQCAGCEMALRDLKMEEILEAPELRKTMETWILELCNVADDGIIVRHLSKEQLAVMVIASRRLGEIKTKWYAAVKAHNSERKAAAEAKFQADRERCIEAVNKAHAVVVRLKKIEADAENALQVAKLAPIDVSGDLSELERHLNKLERDHERKHEAADKADQSLKNALALFNAHMKTRPPVARSSSGGDGGDGGCGV
jgi:hypothetical protein